MIAVFLQCNLCHADAASAGCRAGPNQERGNDIASERMVLISSSLKAKLKYGRMAEDWNQLSLGRVK